MSGFDSAVVMNTNLFRMVMVSPRYPLIFRSTPGIAISDDTRMDICWIKKADFLRKNKGFAPYGKTK